MRPSDTTDTNSDAVTPGVIVLGVWQERQLVQLTLYVWFIGDFILEW